MEILYLYVYPWDGGPADKTEHEGSQALVDSAHEAAQSGEYKEIRGTDRMDLMVLHMRARAPYNEKWNILHPS